MIDVKNQPLLRKEVLELGLGATDNNDEAALLRTPAEADAS